MLGWEPAGEERPRRGYEVEVLIPIPGREEKEGPGGKAVDW